MSDEMNQPSGRDELEERVIALLLGELDSDEVRALEEQLASDAELRAFRDRMQITLGLVRAASHTPDLEKEPVPQQLSDERREALLSTFKVTPMPRKEPKKFSWITVAAVAALIVGVAVPMFLPALAKSKRKAATYRYQRELNTLSEPALETSEQLDTVAAVAATAVADKPLELAKQLAQTEIVLPELKDVHSYEETAEEIRRGVRMATSAGTERVPAKNITSLRLGGGADESEQLAADATVVAGKAVSVRDSRSVRDEMKRLPAEKEARPNQPLSTPLFSFAGRAKAELPTRGQAVGGPRPPLQSETTRQLVREDTEAKAVRRLAEKAKKAPLAPTSSLSQIAAGAQVERLARQRGGEVWDFKSRDVRAVEEGASQQVGQKLDAIFLDDAKADVSGRARPDLIAPGTYVPSTVSGPVGRLSGDKPVVVEAHLGESIGKLSKKLELDREADSRARPSIIVGRESMKHGQDAEVRFTVDYDTEALNRQSQLIAPIAAPAPLPPAPTKPESARRKAPKTLKPKPEISTRENAFSTFSLNVSDVAFKLAKASLDAGKMPHAETVRSEEFLNAFNYHDPAPVGNERVAFAWNRARNPFAHDRDLLRFSIQTAARGRAADQPLNLVVLLDSSGSMERADRERIVREMLGVLVKQLKRSDKVSVVAFARTPRLLIDGAPGGRPDYVLQRVTGLTPEGGTNLEAALETAYQIARRHYLARGNNRVILLTDGAANLGDVNPDTLRERVVAERKRGVAMDCFGVGWEGYNDDLLESLSRNGDGRYGFINDPTEARDGFADLLAGALQVAAADVKAQVEFNPARVTTWRQIGYDKHQLTKEQFRDNTVDAAEIGAAESGTALYSIQVNRRGVGPLGVVRVRFRVPATGEYVEEQWELDYTPAELPLKSAPPAMRLSAVATGFAEWLAANPFAGGVNLTDLERFLTGVPEAFPNDARPRELRRMISQSRTISGE